MIEKIKDYLGIGEKKFEEKKENERPRQSKQSIKDKIKDSNIEKDKIKDSNIENHKDKHIAINDGKIIGSENTRSSLLEKLNENPKENAEIRYVANENMILKCKCNN